MLLTKRGGPRTEEGKQRSSQNALKTGAYARELVLPQESEEEFEAVLSQYIKDLRPQDVVGHTLVRDLAGIAWKKMRFDHIEAKVLMDFQDRPITDEERVGTRYLWREEIEPLIPGMASVTKQDAGQAIACLRLIQEIRWQESTEELALQIELEYPMLHEMLTFKVPQFHIAHTPEEVDPSIKGVSLLDGLKGTDFRDQLGLAQKELASIVWQYRHKNAVLAEYETLRHKRLMQFMERPSHNRTQGDLRRSYSKTMREFYKHEEWRRSCLTLEVEEV